MITSKLKPGIVLSRQPVKLIFKSLLLKPVLVLSMILGTSGLFANTYYISNGGNDLNSGLSEVESWQTIDKVNAIIFQPKSKM